MTKRQIESRDIYRCVSGAWCFLRRYKHLNPEIRPGQHSTQEEADRCERKAGVWDGSR